MRLELLVAVVLCFAVVPAAGAAVPCAPWKTPEKDLRAALGQGYPNEKLASVTASGEASAWDKPVTVTDEDVRVNRVSELFHSGFLAHRPRTLSRHTAHSLLR